MHRYPYFDTHCDTMLKMYDQKLSISHPSLQVNLATMRKYAPCVQVFALFNEGEFSEKDMLSAIAYFKKECGRHNKYIAVRRSSRGIRQNRILGKATALLSIEGLGNQTDFSVDSISKFHMAGVRFASLCWNGDNILCGGSDHNRNGLTPLGAEVLRRMAKLGMILDVSHMSDQSFWDAMQVYDRPVCATHSGSRAICSHPRNLTDAQFGELAKRGGVCGINFYPPFLGGKRPDINQIIAHIEHFMSLGGENHIGIGADFDGVDCLPCEITDSGYVYRLFDALLSLNYKESTINKIAFYNFYKFFLKFEI